MSNDYQITERMIMTSIEKKMIIVTLVMIVCFVISARSCMLEVQENGGVRAIIIDTGKQIKEISKEINEE